MRYNHFIIISSVALLMASCNTLEKASLHGFNSDFYKVKTDKEEAQSVYVNITEDTVDVHKITNDQPEKSAYLSLSLIPSESLSIN